jgi:hypothetical protein
MSRVPIGVDFDVGQEPESEQLLALRTMRRSLERFTSYRQKHGGEPMALARPDLIHELEELIEALDRRVPRVEQAGEASIAGDAAALREKAVRRLAELTSKAVREHQEAHAALEKVLGFPSGDAPPTGRPSPARDRT